jgi:hypothetical protein
MPTVKILGPYRFFFYSSDGKEARHIHVERDGRIGKYWLDPVRLSNSGGFDRGELRKIESLILENQNEFMEAWNEYFSS